MWMLARRVMVTDCDGGAYCGFDCGRIDVAVELVLEEGHRCDALGVYNM